MIASSTNRVSGNTSAEVNQAIENATRISIDRVAGGGPESIARRLDELDQEWDIERVLETMAPTITLLGLTKSILSGQKRWLFFPLMVQSFFLQHALQGWCPPLPVLRRLGFRTAEEINRERYALKALRGDFANSTAIESAAGGRAHQALAAVDQ